LLLLGMILLLGGIQLITIGILAEVSMRTYYESGNKKTYQVRRVWTEEVKEQVTKNKKQETRDKEQEQETRTNVQEIRTNAQEARTNVQETRTDAQEINRNKQLELPLQPKN